MAELANFQQLTSKIDKNVVSDAAGFIERPLKQKYNLCTKKRDNFLITEKDLEILMTHLWCSDDHSYLHERYRVPAASPGARSPRGTRARRAVPADPPSDDDSYVPSMEDIYSDPEENLAWRAEVEKKRVGKGNSPLCAEAQRGWPLGHRGSGVRLRGRRGDGHGHANVGGEGGRSGDDLLPDELLGGALGHFPVVMVLDHLRGSSLCDNKPSLYPIRSYLKSLPPSVAV
ncbi:hypothetical protein VE03_10367 [Pseudogymnoascus sp. 23342-1-I1]|nr:hypothetical protein VE03_10367 [Pseudogymnoascus sp. 23342-1-I1]